MLWGFFLKEGNKMKKIKIEKEIFGENAILIEAILNGLIVKNRKKEKENKKK